jgi:hypothetical protein
MPDKHEFYAQPRGNRPWCFCRDQGCAGWAAYVAWHQGATGRAGEPDKTTAKTHEVVTRLLTNLARSYSKLFGADVDFNTALDLADLERAGELERAWQRGSR